MVRKYYCADIIKYWFVFCWLFMYFIYWMVDDFAGMANMFGIECKFVFGEEVWR